MLYPFVFVPRLKPRLWGGRNLASLYGKPLPPGEPVGESWEISDRPGDESLIANGPLAGRSLRWLIAEHGPALLGAATAPHGRFPLLVKILDAREILSVQVHPPARLAAQLGGEPKSELWYVTQAAPGATLCAGLKEGVSRAEFEQRLQDGTVAECIHPVPVQAGDALFLPSGRIHALGTNLVIFEIQQNSDTTYRVFDWNRVGPDGRLRELHLEQALACIDFDDFAPRPIQAAWQADGPVEQRSLLAHPLFSVTEHRATAADGRLGSGERVAVVGVVSGAVQLDHPASGERLILKPGQFALLPASAQPVAWSVTTASTWLVAMPGTLS